MAQDNENRSTGLAFNEEEVLRLLELARNRGRGYADFWQWPPNKRMAEWHIAKTLLRFLTADGHDDVASLESAERDPPDCVAILRNGLRVGIEVTELVNTKMVEAHANRMAAERRGKAPNPAKAIDPDRVALWGISELREAIIRAIGTKDVPAHEGPYDQYLVVLHTDEDTITHSVVSDALLGLGIWTTHIDRAFVLLSYDPSVAERFPDGCPVVEVPLLRRPAGPPVRR